MNRIFVIYPNSEDCHFNMNYYVQKHVPLVEKRLGSVLKAVSVDEGISGVAGSPAPFIAIGSLLIESMEGYLEAMNIHGEELRADIPNFTTIKPIIQISEVLY